MIHFQNSLDTIDEIYLKKRYDELGIDDIFESLLYRVDQLYSFVQFTIQLHKIFTHTFEFNTLVCFQHKMADAVSIPMFLFHNGVYIEYRDRQFNLKHIGSLFKNCPFDENEIVELVKEDIPERKRCPPTYYKQIVYTYRGDIIYPDMLDNVYFVMEPIFDRVPSVQSATFISPSPEFEDKSIVYTENPLQSKYPIKRSPTIQDLSRLGSGRTRKNAQAN